MAIKFSPEMIEYLSKLYVHERHNSLVYSQVANYLNVQGYGNLSKYYEDWSQHEIEHSMLVRDFANYNNLILDMTVATDDSEVDLNNSPITTFAQITVDVENKTSDMYNVLLDMAVNEDNGFIKKFAYDFLQEQIEETNKALTIFDSVKNIDDNRAMLQLFDNSFEYETGD